MALSAPQTQVTLASFQKGSLLNHSRLPLRNKTKQNWEEQYVSLPSSLDLVTQGQIKSLAMFLAAFLGSLSSDIHNLMNKSGTHD